MLHSRLFRSCAGLAGLALLILAPRLAEAQAGSQANSWIAPSAGDWNTAADWSQGQIPNGVNGQFYDVLNSSPFLITHASGLGPSGVDTLSSYQNTGTGGLALTGGVLAGAQANAAGTFQGRGTQLNGGTLRNFTLLNSDALTFPNTLSGSTLDSMVLDGGLTLNGGSVILKGTFRPASGATFHLEKGGVLDFRTTTTLANATIAFGSSNGVLGEDSSHTLTLDSTLNVTGTTADIVGGPLVNNTLLSSSQGGLWYITPSQSLVNNGTIEARVAGSGLSLSGGSLNNTGTLQATNFGSHVDVSVTTLNNSGVFQALGGGQVNLSAYNYSTLGTIQAAGSGSAVFLGGFDSSTGAYTITLGNGEHLSASGGGTLHLATTLNNTGMTFDPDAYGPTGSFVLTHGRILNGTIAHSDDLAFDSSGQSPNILENVALSGGLDLTRRGNLGEAEVRGPLQYSPSAVFNIGGGGGELDFYGSHTFDNATIKINGGSLGVAFGTLTLGPNLVLQGSGGLIGRDLFSSNIAGALVNNTAIIAAGSGNFWSIEEKTVVNNGLFQVSGGGRMVVVGDSALTNAGTLDIGAGSDLSLDTCTQSGGSTAVSGTLYINHAPGLPFGQIGVFTLQGGLLGGTGRICGDVQNTGGTLHPGPGGLQLSNSGYGGNYTQGAGGVLQEDLGGSGQSSVFAVEGVAALDGTVNVTLAGGFAPKAGDQFPLLTYGSRTGAFASVASATPGYSFSVTYLPTQAVLTVTAAPVSLSALTFPTPVPGGTVFNGTVTLSGPAPADTVVGLSSSDSSVIRLHRAVIVPAGSSSAAFAVNTFRSHVTKTVTITATLGAVVQAQDLTITGR